MKVFLTQSSNRARKSVDFGTFANTPWTVSGVPSMQFMDWHGEVGFESTDIDPEATLLADYRWR